MAERTDKLRRVYAVVRLHGLAASVEAQERGPDRPVALCDEGRRRIVSVSPAAGRRGVTPGMSRWEAERLCPELLIADPDEKKYAYFRQRVLDICGDYTPRVLLDRSSPDSLQLDLTGTERLFGPAGSIAQEIRNRLKAEMGVLASVGVGPNPTVARLASESARPGRVLEVTPEGASAFVGGLPLSALPGVDEDWAQRLSDMGLRRAGDLAGLPVESVERALGRFGRRLWEIARGDEPGVGEEPGRPAGPGGETIFSAQVEVRPATDEVHRLRSALRTAADDLSRKLRQHGLIAQQISTTVVFSDLRKVSARRTLGRATRSGEVIFHAAGALFDRMKLGARRVRRVRITAARLAPGPHGGQLGLPLLEREERRERLAERVNQILDRYGEGAVKRGSTSRP
jgi:DNA polymerase-4